jgi:hypothetical protein
LRDQLVVRKDEPAEGGKLVKLGGLAFAECELVDGIRGRVEYILGMLRDSRA